MPLYIVRWPTFAISLIQARDENDLSVTLDEIGDPSGCKWKVYKGPLHLGFNLNLDFEDQTNYEFVPTKPKAKIKQAGEFLLEGAKFKFLDDEHSDTHTEMWDNFMKFCFPELWKCDEKRFNDSEVLSPEKKTQAIKEIETAAMKELSAFFKGGEDWKNLKNRVKRKEQNEDN